MRTLSRIPIIELIYKFLFLYPSPINLTYLWNFGSLAGIALMVQVVTGVGLSFWYIPSVDLAFNSVEFIMREVWGGWWLRYLHANGASMFFLVVYIHMGRGLFYGSYTKPKDKVWYTGVVIFLLMIITAFLGYILPWGQMSYWAAMVITSLISVLPAVGNEILIWLWGGVSIDQPTLTRIYGLHFTLPFVILSLVVLHILFLHEHGSSNPLGVKPPKADVTFHPYFSYKDILGLLVAVFVYLAIVVISPNMLLHSDNYILADPGVTPAHIVPEWYFLPFYGILRSIPDKLFGVVAMATAIITLFFLPIISKPLVQSGTFRPVFKLGFVGFVIVWFLLGWSGGNPVEYPYYEICQLATIAYFSFFGVFNPYTIWLEKVLYEIYKSGVLAYRDASEPLIGLRSYVRWKLKLKSLKFY